jgi:hypothetical protein
MADIGTDRQEKREINRELIAITREDRIRQHRAKQAKAPAPAAAVYQDHGDATDWDNYQPELCDAPADLYGDLPDETPIDPSL